MGGQSSSGRLSERAVTIVETVTLGNQCRGSNSNTWTIDDAENQVVELQDRTWHSN